MSERKKVFICSPFRGDMAGNSVRAAGYCRRAYEEGCLPIAPHLLFPQFLDEGSLKERADGISMGLELLMECDEIWVFGKPTRAWSRKSSLRWSMASMSGFGMGKENRKHEAGNDCDEGYRE